MVSSRSHIESDVDLIAKQLRWEINNRRKEILAAPAVVSSGLDDAVSDDLAALRANSDIYNVWFTSHRRLLGRFVIRAKKIFREFLTPVLVRQVIYNEANSRVVAHLNGRVASLADRAQRDVELDQKLQQLRGELDALKQVTKHEIAAAQSQLGSLGQRQESPERFLNDTLQKHAQAIQDADRRLSQTERKVLKLIYTSGDGHQSAQNLDGKKDFPIRNVDLDFDYFGFEAHFRGSEDLIKARQKVYIPIFVGHEPILDLGCGRGEFLELLRESGIKASGVDLDLDMLLLCRNKGLDVVRADALEELANRPDESLGGIFSAQVIEHLEPVEILRLLKLCQQKLKEGGVLLLETLNPESLQVHYKWFCMDLSHKRLIHPNTLQFVLQSLGFRDIETTFSSPHDQSIYIPRLDIEGSPTANLEPFNKSMERLNTLLSASSDYAISATK